MNTLIHFQYESSLRFMEQKEEEAVFHRRTQPEYRKIAKRKNIRKQCTQKNIGNGKISEYSGDGKIKISESIGKYRKQKIKILQMRIFSIMHRKIAKGNIESSKFTFSPFCYLDLLLSRLNIYLDADINIFFARYYFADRLFL